MTTSPPTQSPTFTPKRRRILGQVYNLILSWRSKKMELETTSSETVKFHVGETVKPTISQNGVSDD